MINNIDHGLLEILEEEVAHLEHDYKSHKAMILTEEDVKCLLYLRLHRHFQSYQPTMNPDITGLAIHSELSYYNADGRLAHAPDLAIISPEALSIFHSVEYGDTPGASLTLNPLPSKGFEFGGDSLAIELKFCRSKKGISHKAVSALQKDFDKLKTLRDLRETLTQGRNHIYGAVVIFNKTDRGRHLIQEFIQRNEHRHIRILYASGQVNFTTFQPGATCLQPIP